MIFERRHRVAAALVFVLALGASLVARADRAYPYPGTETVKTSYSYGTLVARLKKAIADNKMALVAQASASQGAAARGIRIPGNAVLMVFRNDYAVRMLSASVPAGIEPPLRLYVTENPDGTASVTYRHPSAVFAPYGSAKLDAMAKELDPVFARIVKDAARSE